MNFGISGLVIQWITMLPLYVSYKSMLICYISMSIYETTRELLTYYGRPLLNYSNEVKKLQVILQAPPSHILLTCPHLLLPSHSNLVITNSNSSLSHWSSPHQNRLPLSQSNHLFCYFLCLLWSSEPHLTTLRNSTYYMAPGRPWLLLHGWQLFRAWPLACHIS